MMYVWGENTHGELSVGHARNHAFQPEPAISLSKGSTVAHMSFGSSHSLALSTHSDIFSCGSWVSGRLGHANVHKDLHRFRRLRHSSLVGRTGEDAETQAKMSLEEPLPADECPASPTVPSSDKFVQVVCGHHHSVALTRSGVLYTWGGNLYGKLGHEGTQVVRVLEGTRIQQVDCGMHHTVVASGDGAVYTFGGGGKHNSFGQLGLGEDTLHSTVPTLVPALQGIAVVEVSCGAYHTLALTDTQLVYGWGRGDFGQLGTGEKSNISSPILIESLSPAKREQEMKRAAEQKSASLTQRERDEARFYAPITRRRSKKEVSTFLTGSGSVRSISCGDRHSLVLTDNGDIYSFGCGLQGQLGHRKSHNETVPRLVQVCITCPDGFCSPVSLLIFPFYFIVLACLKS